MSLCQRKLVVEIAIAIDIVTANSLTM